MGEHGDPNDPLQPIRLVGVRNGVFSGQVVVSSDKAIKDLRVKAGGLNHADGKHEIPAANVQVRYPRLDGGYRYKVWFDGIETTAPKMIPVRRGTDGAVQPIFVTVKVPRDAKAGKYVGQLEVSTDELDAFKVPVHLSVADWTLPDPYKYRAYAGIYQSPETLSMHYKVPMWSEKHWQLIEQSFKILAYVGSDLVHVPIINRSQTGNDEGWIYWVKKQDGTYGYDFKVFDRYAGLIKKYLIEPDFIVLHVWRSPVYDGTPAMTKPHFVTQLDPKTGKLSPLAVPNYGTKESLAFWRPVMLGAKERLTKLGLAKSISLGVLIEGNLPPTLTEFHKIIPEAGWVRGCHPASIATGPTPMRGGSKLVLQEHAYPVHRVDPTKKIPAIWERNRVGARFYRTHAEVHELQDYRMLAERNMYFRSRGFGRVALDYWPVAQAGGGARPIYQRWPESTSAQRGVYTFRLGWPGAKGAESTLRLEAIREGLQETEAAIFVAEAQHKRAGKLGKALAERCRRIIVKRVNYCIERTHQPWPVIFFHVNHYGWQGLNAELFQAAAEVAAKLGG